MNVALDKAKIPIKPGFGKIPDRPSFAKSASMKAMTGTKDTTASAPASSLKKTVSSNIATSSRSSVFTERARNSSSSTFIPATRFMNASDFTRDRTTTAAWGSIQGDHYIEGQTGVTKRSYRRMVQAQQVTVAPQYQGRYTDFGNMYSQKMSPMQILSDLGTTVTSIIGMFKSSGTESGGSTTSSVSNLSSQTMQVAQTLAGNVGDISTASTTVELETAVAKAKNQQAELSTLLNSDDYKNIETNLQAAKDGKTKIDAQVKEQQGIVSNQNNTIELLSNTRIPAQESVVSNAEANLAKAQSMATAQNPNDAAIRAAEDQLQQAKDSLQQLKDQLKTAEETRNAAQKKLDGESGLLAQQKQADNEITSLTALQNDKQTKTTQLNTIEQSLQNAEQRQDKLLKQEEKKLDGLLDDLKKLDAKIAKESNESKKAELKQEYTQLANTFNTMVANSTSQKYAGASIDSSSTFAENNNAKLQDNMNQMRASADDYAKKKNEEAMNNLMS